MKKRIGKIKMLVRIIDRLPLMGKIAEVTAESVRIAKKNLGGN